MRKFICLPVSKVTRITLLPLIALTFGTTATAADYACDGFVGSFANRPDNEAVFKIAKDGDGFVLFAQGDSPDDWERVPLKVGIPEDIQKEMVAEGRKMIPLTCALSADGVLLWQFPAGSPDNPSESKSRNLYKYPQKTPYFMVVNAGVVAGETGLYRVRTED
ncbi:hypothetical protein [Pseudomonas sp. CC120222-01a]|uniref:hypothetical protein n=1 Tax=Pseudomonas sp. CC120222-01a TaxID=1378075 RepID=UPI000D93E876|nr:hypothetical protein [Pseudomonas sp. CC120222-01a]PVZ39624.1 hypothetical protein N430_03533 [Pseudomonas sp. CC120222-01a]